MSFNFSVDKSGLSSFYRKLNSIKDECKEKKEVFVGWTNEAFSQRGTGYATIASINEYGAHVAGFYGSTVYIPPRPFIRPTVIHNKANWFLFVGKELKSQKLSYNAILEKLADTIKEQLQDSIRSVTKPPLAPLTLRLRKEGGDKPLIETGGFINAIKTRVS